MIGGMAEIMIEMTEKLTGMTKTTVTSIGMTKKINWNYLNDWRNDWNKNNWNDCNYRI